MRWPIALMVWLLASPLATAQLSGSSFGSSRGFGGSSSSSSSSSYGGGSSFGGSSYGGGESYSDRMERERQEREAREAERRRAEERERRRREEEERRRAEEERLRQLEADRAMPPAERAALQRRFGDRITYPAPTGPETELSHAPEPSYAADAPSSRRASLPGAATLATRPVRVEANWIAGGICGGLGFLFLAFFGFVVGGFRRRITEGLARRRPARPLLPQSGRSSGSCEIRRISLGFDWTERARIQQALEQMAGRYDMRSAQGMHGAASEAAQLLIDALPAARYGMFQRYLESTHRAERRFFDLAQDLKSRFRHDTRRGGQRDFQAKAEEGQGLVVVSFVVGATRHLGPMGSRLDRRSIAQLLQAAVRISPEELVALEVVWSPAADADRMSSLELERVYPELMPLDSASLGGISCGYCQAVHAAELPKCPACGATR